MMKPGKIWKLTKKWIIWLGLVSSFSFLRRATLNMPIKSCLLANHLQEALIVHLLVRDVIAVTEKSIGGNRRRSVLCLFFALQMDCLEGHAMLLRHGF